MRELRTQLQNSSICAGWRGATRLKNKCFRDRTCAKIRAFVIFADVFFDHLASKILLLVRDDSVRAQHQR